MSSSPKAVHTVPLHVRVLHRAAEFGLGTASLVVAPAAAFLIGNHGSHPLPHVDALDAPVGPTASATQAFPTPQNADHVQHVIDAAIDNATRAHAKYQETVEQSDGKGGPDQSVVADWEVFDHTRAAALGLEEQASALAATDPKAALALEAEAAKDSDVLRASAASAENDYVETEEYHPYDSLMYGAAADVLTGPVGIGAAALLRYRNREVEDDYAAGRRPQRAGAAPEPT